jgi:hypothetical protein
VSDLPRWSEDGATGDELALLKASRRERPDPAARARTLAALGLGGGGGGATGGPASPGRDARGAPVKVGRAWKLASLGGITAFVATVGLWYARPHQQPASARRDPGPARADVAPRAPREAPVVVAAPPDAPANDRNPASDPGRAAHKAFRRPPHEAARPPRAPSPSLAEEVAALERARAALTDGDPDAALRALDAYRARCRQGKLSSEEVVLRVQALLAKGNQGEATFVADTFSATHPGDPYVQRLNALLSAAVKSSKNQ